MVELLTGIVFWLAATSAAPYLLQGLMALFLTVLILVLVYDLAHTIIPDEFVLALIVLACVRLVFEVYTGSSLMVFGWGLLAGLSAAGPFVFLWVISQGRWIGLGDAKLAFPLGIWIGIQGVVSLVMLAFWIGALLSLLIIAIQSLLKRGQFDLRIMGRALTMKSEIPFAPFLIMAFLAVYIFGIDAFTLITYVI